MCWKRTIFLLRNHEYFRGKILEFLFEIAIMLWSILSC